MGRKSKEDLEKIKKEYNVDQLYSWSKYNTMETDWYTYFLKYILHKKEDQNNSIYADAGNIVHSLLEEFYKGKLKKYELENIYDEKMHVLELSGMKFDRTNDEQNIKTSDKYNCCNKHFLRNFIPIKGENIEIEKFLLIKVSKFLFQGYSDFEHCENRNGEKKVIITDFKTSTIYTGEKLEKEKGQLLLYALGKIQEGWDIKNIVIRWLFTKYVTITIPTKEGVKTRNISRHEIGSCLKASVSSQFKKMKLYSNDEIENYLKELLKNKSIDHLPKTIKDEVGEIELSKKGEIKKNYINKIKKCLESIKKYTECQIENYLEEMVLMNDINVLPKDIRDLYKIEDCFVEIPFTKKDLRELQIKIVTKIVEAIKKELQYKKTKDDSIFYEEITKKNSYFHAVLSGYSPKLHKPYKDYLEKLKEDKKDLNSNEDDDDIEALLAGII